MNNYTRNLVAFSLLLFSSLSFAEVRFLVEGGLHVGGDDLVTVTFTDGSTQDINAGGLFGLGLGLSADVSDSLVLRFVHSYRFDEVSADNGSIDYSRWISNLSLMYKINRWQFGGGLAYHSNIRLNGDGVAAAATARFDNATGFLLEFDYFFTEKFYLGGQYTNIDYTYQSTNLSVDASSIGVVTGFQF